MSTALVLFDIDGTLLITGGASTRCIYRAAEHVLGRTIERMRLTPGSMDHALFYEVAQRCGVVSPAQYLDAYKAQYLAELNADLLAAPPGAVKVMPGVPELLRTLQARPDVALGLLTGNFASAAEQKLHLAGIDLSSFEIRCFAEHAELRSQLVPRAIEQLAQTCGETASPRQVILVGDTPRDIACARDAGCLVLSVATGFYALAELQAAGPDAAVATLEDYAPLDQLIDQAMW
jgi:phosphoglycolate phosphatase-like HAD superfamily hydrolase